VTLDRPEGRPDEFGVYAIRYASREGRRGEHFHGHDDRSGEPHPTAYFIWLAVSAEHTVVIDTGIGPDRAARIPGLRYLASPPDILEAMGVPAASVGHVVLTHLHYDHTGTARAFATARYVLQRAEAGYWTGPWARRIARERPLVDTGDIAHLMTAREEGRMLVLDGDATVVPGLSVHLVGGHTAGMQVVRVRTARGHVVLASDASHFYENIEDDRPFAILHHLPGMYGAVDRIKELADGPGLVVAGHDPEVLDRYPALPGAPGGHVAVIA
jgi:glyoxylase-like metal-dependent hydrolase (beta-lactamase superfamily II)